MSTKVAERLEPKAREVARFTAPVHWNAEARSDGDGLRVSGHAALFDRESKDLGGFKETLAPGAFKRALQRSDFDAFLLFAHNTENVLARVSAGTLEIREDPKGMRFDAELVPTQLGHDMATLIRTGHVTEMSFAFTVAKDEWRGRKRRITEVERLHEISIVPTPAYGDTSVALARSLASPEVRKELELTTIEAVKANARARIEKVRPRPVYGPDSEHSWFRDRLSVAEAERRRSESIRKGGESGRVSGVDPGDPVTPHRGQTLADAKRRLAEHRDLATTTDSAGGYLIPKDNVPVFIADEFAAAARAQATLATALPYEPLPESGMTVKQPRITTGATVAVTSSENSAVSETDPAFALVDVPIATVAGLVDLSRQVFDRGQPDAADVVLATELGRALGEKLDSQIITGTGSGGQTQGLSGLSGILTVAYTDSTPTAPELLSKLWSAYLSLSGSSGYGVADPSAYVSILHPRRLAFLLASSDAGSQLRATLPGETIVTGGIPTNGGASTSEDHAYVLVRDMVRIHANPPQLAVFFEAGSGTNTVRVRAFQYVALTVRQPSAVAKVSGTGFTPPSL